MALCAVDSFTENYLSDSQTDRFVGFVFGGAVNTAFDLASLDDEVYNDIYVLSLPAFRWFQANATVNVRRSSHACSVIGKRQMISIGGRPPSSRRALGRESDPSSSGIGIFDITLLRRQDQRRRRRKVRHTRFYQTLLYHEL